MARALRIVMGSLLGMAFASAARAGGGVDGATSAEVELDDAGACVCVHIARLDGPVLSTVTIETELARIWRLSGVDVRYPAAPDPQACAAPSALHVVLLLVDGEGTRQAAKALHASAGARAVAVLHAPGTGPDPTCSSTARASCSTVARPVAAPMQRSRCRCWSPAWLRTRSDTSCSARRPTRARA